MKSRFAVIAGKARHLAGWRKDPLPHAAHPRLMAGSEPTPDTADLTDKLPPVNDQGTIGACTANTFCEAFEFLEGKALGDVLYSRLDLYAATRAYEGVPLTEDSGCIISDVVKVLNERGVCLESDWPYDPSKFSLAPPDGVARKKVLLSLHLPDVPTMLACIGNQQFPFGYGFNVPESMMSDEVASSGVLPLPKNGESFVGGHAVLIVGYDKHKVISGSTGAFLARNSWGADWGQKGNFWMPFDYVNHGLADDAWTLRRAEVSP